MKKEDNNLMNGWMECPSGGNITSHGNEYRNSINIIFTAEYKLPWRRQNNDVISLLWRESSLIFYISNLSFFMLIHRYKLQS